MTNEELIEEVKRYYSDNFDYISSDQPTLSILTNIAGHFAEWGYLRAAEKYNEIEYNRQRAEESVPNDLEDAAHSYSESDEPLYSPGHRFHWDDDALFGKQIETTFIAGAKWQAKRMKDEKEKE